MTRRFQEVTGATKKYLQCLKPRRITWSDVCSPRFLCGLHRRDTGCSLVSWWALWTKPGELFIPVSGLYYGGPDGQNRTTAHKRFFSNAVVFCGLSSCSDLQDYAQPSQANPLSYNFSPGEWYRSSSPSFFQLFNWRFHAFFFPLPWNLLKTPWKLQKHSTKIV